MSPDGKWALDYFLGRGISIKTIKHFGLGASPDSWDALLNHLKSKGFSVEDMLVANVVGKSSRGNYYDVFRKRVICPIINIRGNVVAFSGRAMPGEDKGRKYVNTSDTPVFKKGQNLFGINFAKNHCTESIILVEGNLDVVTLHQAGFENTVASLGTALKTDQINLLARYTKEIILAQDADAAGQEAIKKSIQLMQNTGLNVRVVTIPDGKDPDEFIRKNGLEFQCIRQANDTYFVLMAIFLAERITYVKNRLVHYRCDTEGSITSGKVAVPPCAFDAYMYLKNELEKQETYTKENKKSFVNRAARGMLRILHITATEADFEKVRDFLVNEGFAGLGLICDKEYYDAEWVYNDIQSVLTRTPAEHMMYKFGEARKSKDKIKSTSIKRKQQLDKNEKLLDKKTEENEVLKQELASLKAKVKKEEEAKKQLKAKAEKLQREKNELEKKYKAVDSSFMALRRRWYVRLFVKLENIIKGLKK